MLKVNWHIYIAVFALLFSATKTFFVAAQTEEDQTAPTKSLPLKNFVNDASLDIETLAQLLDKHDNSEPELALKYGEQAIQMLAITPNPELEANILNHLSWANIRLGEYEQASKLQIRALRLSIQLGNQEETAYAYNLAGVIKRQQGYYEESIVYYQQALEIRTKQGDIKGIANVLNNLGVVYNLIGQYYQAIEFLNQSISFKQQLGDEKGIANTLNNIANIYLEAGDLAKSLSEHNKALKLREALGVESAIAESYNSLGNLHLKQFDYIQAKQYFEKALLLNTKVGIRRAEGETLQNIGNLLSIRNNITEAINYYQRALNLSQQMFDEVGSAQLTTKIAKLHILNNDYSMGIQLLKESIISAERVQNFEILQMVHSELAQVYIKALEYDLAYQHAIKSLAISNDLNNDVKRQSAYFTLSKLFEENGSTQKALEYFVEYKRVSDIILKQQTQHQIGVAQSKYDFDIKQKENEKLRQENLLRREQVARVAAEESALASNKRLERGAWATGFVLFSLVMFFLINRRAAQKKLALERRINEKMEHLEEMKNEFLSVVSHELLTPINGIVGGLQLIETDEANEEPISIIRTSAHRMESLVADIINYTMFKVEGGEVRFSEVSIIVILDKLQEKYLNRCTHKGLNLNWHYSGNFSEHINCPGKAIETICEKLLDNAVKFTREGEITVNVQAIMHDRVRGLEISIADTGVGIESNYLKAIFNLFQQEDSGLARSFGGLGLGLALCDYLVKVIDGQITVSSVPSVGSRFVLWFPLK